MSIILGLSCSFKMKCSRQFAYKHISTRILIWAMAKLPFITVNYTMNLYGFLS